MLSAQLASPSAHRKPRGLGFVSSLLLLGVGLSPRVPVAAAEPSPPFYAGLGSFHRPITTDVPAAQRYFDQGLALLYGFNHDEAIRSFAEAARLDPECASAWWGLALASCPHINQADVSPDKLRRGADALRQAQAHAAQASPVEQALIRALAARYADPFPADRRPLDEAYAQAMRQAWHDHPQDPDVGVLFAESLMNLRPWDLWGPAGEPRPETPEIVATLETVLAFAPEHPQALHLYIHAVEASPQPDRALAEANRLRFRQPGLGHLVHMPSHIDVRLGLWEAAIEANARAIAADRAFREQAPQADFYQLYMAHNHHMLLFAALMSGQSQQALATAHEMVAAMPADWVQANPGIADGFLAMPLEVLVRFGRWDEVLASPQPDAAFPVARALWHVARGIAAASQQKPELARAEEAAFLQARAAVPAEWRVGNNLASDVLAVAGALLAGEVRLHAGETEAGLAELRRAVSLEDQLRYDEPPDWIHPVRHALGAWLLAADQAVEAEAVYRQDLIRLPENGWSLFGLAESLDRQGRSDEAAVARARFTAAWRQADVAIGSSCFCQPGLAVTNEP